MRIALQLVTYGGADTIPFLLQSLARQTRKDWELFVFDAGSPSADREALERVWQESPVVAQVEWGENIGFAGGHNLLWIKHQAEWVFLLNPDAVLAEDYVERLVTFLEAHPGMASASGSILRWETTGSGRPVLTKTVDSLGLRRLPWGAVQDYGAGKRFEHVAPMKMVFGVSGCAAVLRRSLAEKAHAQGLLFMERLHTYKEDVELAYRLRECRYVAGICVDAFVWHRRTVRPEGRFRRPIGRREFQSYRNHWLIAIWHWRWYEWLNPLWIPYECAKACWYALRAPWVLGRAGKEIGEMRCER